MTDGSLRIGEVARRAGTTVRTIRYYEEIGLLEGAEDRAAGTHRVYAESDVERLTEVLRLKDLLGVSLDELRELVAAQDARAVLRQEFHKTTSVRRRRAILVEALGYLDRQLELVARRRADLDTLDGELNERRELVLTRLEETAAPLPAG
jgi:DNA-binding transcriptional MerR regulator